ncbi:hypothetical protein EQH57_0261 [Dictyocoela roeselum]|nr:hypothetical protein EQH57_0261 [Dictyocoela roeselum]
MTDWLTRYTEIKILFDTTSKTIISAITKKWTEIHGIPKFILSDNGRQFISVNFEKFCRENGIKHIFSGEYNPTGNSIVERRNLEIGFMLRIQRGNTLTQLKRAIWNRLNLCHNRVLEQSPVEIFLGRSIFENVSYKKSPDIDKLKNKIKKELTVNMKIKNTKRIFTKYNIADKILIKNFSPDKVEPKWLGPYEILGYSRSRNNVIINKNNKRVKIPIKNTKPFGGGENVVLPHIGKFKLPALILTTNEL